MPFPGILASHLPNTFPCNYLDIEAPVPRVPEFSRCSVSRHRMSIAAPHGYRGTAWVSRHRMGIAGVFVHAPEVAVRGNQNRTSRSTANIPSIQHSPCRCALNYGNESCAVHIS